MTAYFISGLGADERAFQRITLSAGIEIKHIHWIEPVPKEKFSDYVRRLSLQIDQESGFILVGLSFGGMAAIEMAKFLSPKKLILISSIKERPQLRYLYRIIGTLRLNRLVPGSLMKKSNLIIDWLFGVKKKKDRELLHRIIKDSSPHYLYWSINHILNWRNKFIPSNLFHIHGEKDKILPCKLAKPDKVVPGAGHLMVLTHAGEVSRIISEELSGVDRG